MGVDCYHFSLLFYSVIQCQWGFPGGTRGKEPTCQCRRHETRVWSLDGEDPLEKGATTHSNILAWRIPWTEELGRLLSTGSQRLRHDWSDLASSTVSIQQRIRTRRIWKKRRGWKKRNWTQILLDLKKSASSCSVMKKTTNHIDLSLSDALAETLLSSVSKVC